MKMNLKKEKFEKIETGFSVLKEDPLNKTAIEMIKKELDEMFGYDFDINVVIPEKEDSAFFVMSVYPEVSTMDKIISSIMSDNKKKDEAVKKIWAKNKKWTLEIDKRLLTNTIIQVDQKELTALLLHEIGHVVCSNSLPTRFVTLLQYEVAKSNMKTKMMLKDKIFRKVLCIPILNACIGDDKSKNSLKNEIKADTYAKKMGYTKELNSVLKKLIQSSSTSNKDKDENLKTLTNFSTETLDQLKQRQDNVVKDKLELIKTECVSPYFAKVVEEIYESWFPEREHIYDIIQEKAASYNDDEYIIERFLIFGPKKLERIDPAEIDYIDVKISTIQNAGDKLMLISYLNSKLDIVNYYLSILADENLSKKYTIPNSYRQLVEMKQRLERLHMIILKYKIPTKKEGLLVQWPSGYEG